MAALDSASSSRVPRGKYDVFISFRGPDVRSGFLSHLEKWLLQNAIDVYVDDRLESGEEISSSLVKAIEGSKIALVVFSKDYASSKWCLEELVKIMEREEANQQIVIPVFYNVNPSDVRNQENTYADAFIHLEQKFNDNMDKLQIWRSVLKKSANLSGHHSIKFPNESKLIDAIVEDVLKKLEDNSPILSNPHLIGHQQNFKSVESLMKIKPKEVLTLGIWGMGGIGKTTLARGIFDKFLSKFESHCFLENVREKSTKTDGLNYLCQELVSKLLKRKNDIDVNEARRRLQLKKVLIVVDDVDNPRQVRDLVGQHLSLLGQGSRIIVTSRDKHVLKSGGIDDKYIHEVNILNFEESLKLFSVHAFNQSQPKMGYQELSKTALAIAGGIPLALEVLGSHFHSREQNYWASELRKLKKCPHEQIQNILKTSYDGLHDMDKEIFLDIAFFFVGQQKDEITYGLEACGFEAVSGIQNLIDKALIKSQDRYIVMHDLIREMAEKVVQKNSKTPSRLNDAEELCGRLKSNKGTDKVEVIILNADERKYLQLGADIFKKMNNLRIIKLLVPIELPGLDSFPNKLRYLHWCGYPLEYLPSGSCFENLVELYMGYSNVKRLWDGKQDLTNLKKLNLSHSKKLMELPDFSMAHKLEIVDLSGCKNLRSVHPSILSLHSVVEMNLSHCKKLESLESETHLESLSELRMEGCDSLKRFCLSSKKLRDIDLLDIRVEILDFSNGQCTELRALSVVGDTLRSLQLDGLCCSTNLEVFRVTEFKQVINTKVLHSLFYAWHNLTYLCLDGWSYLREIPDSIKVLTRLKVLSLNDSAVETLPASINHLSILKCIYLRSCERLKSILGLPPSLEELDANGCTSLREIPNRIKGLTRLKELSLNDSSVETLPAFNDLSSLKHIYLRRCKMLKSILGLPPFLEELDARECTSLETVCSSPLLHNPCGFNFFNCVKLDESSLGFIEKLTNSLMTSPHYDKYYSYKSTHDHIAVCYPGSRVPKWMKYKQMTEPSRAIEFSCNPKRSHGIMLCCVAPGHLISNGLTAIYCRISYGHYYKCCHKYDYYPGDRYLKSNSNHVFLWFMKWDLFITRSSKDIKISCEFPLGYCNESFKQELIPVVACGVHVLCHSEPEPEPEPKRLKNYGFFQPTLMCLARKYHDNFIYHPLQRKFLRMAKQKEVSLLGFL